MITRKELICLNIKNLSQEEINLLSDYELAYCDNCGEIDLSDNLKWLDNEDFYDDNDLMNLLHSFMLSICNICYDKRKRITQCKDCCKYFVAWKNNVNVENNQEKREENDKNRKENREFVDRLLKENTILMAGELDTTITITPEECPHCDSKNFVIKEIDKEKS